MTIVTKQAAQGDVLIERCDTTDLRGLKQTKPVLALGEATGHHHRFDDLTGEKRVLGFYKEGDDLVIAGGSPLAQFVQIKGSEHQALPHEEHGPIAFTPGEWRAVQQVEYSPEAIRNVAD